MRRMVLTIAILSFAFFGFSQVQAFDTVNKLGVGLDGGIIIPTNGNVTSDSTLSDFFDVGPSFGLHVRYGIIKEISIETGFKYSYMKLKDEVNDEPSKDPYLNMPEIYLDGIFNIGSLMGNEDSKINPFLRAGVGLYPWKFTQDGVNGDAIALENGENFKKTSFGINFGGGLEVFATPTISIFAEGKYHYVFAKDEDTFGVDFDDNGHLDVTAGFTYYFPLTKSSGK